MINWWMALLGGSITVLLMLGLALLGGLRWWQRRAWYLQLLLMIVIPVIAITIMLLILWFLNIYTMEDAAGLVIGTALATMGPLLATSYLIEQIRVAFSDEGDDDDPSA